MNKKGSIFCTKKLVCVLTAAVLMLGITVSPVTADAADAANIPSSVYYDDTYDIKDYWDEDATKRTAPVEDGYVFGGWYSDESTPLTEETAATATTAIAKFVPAYVLSVKAQIEYAAQDGEYDTSYIRVVTSVDSTKYQNVSFDIYGNNKNQVSGVPEIKTVYDSIKYQTGTDETTSEATYSTIEANAAFGEAASKFVVLKLTNITKDNSHKIIYVRPNWTTMDGTKVKGLAKYIRVEDGFDDNEYISIPVNLLEGKEVAAGIVELSYAAYANYLEVAEVDDEYLIDAGRLLPAMSYKVDTKNYKITFVGNAETVDVYNSKESIYANVRFKVKSGVTLPDGFLGFDMTAGEFTNWDEVATSDESVTVTAWDYQY